MKAPRLFCLFLGLLFSFGIQAAVDFKKVDQELQSSEGLIAEVHGADRDHGLFVVVIRNNGDFFDYVQVPIVADYTSPTYREVVAALQTIDRHDMVRLKGSLHGWLEAAQRHILVSSLEIVRKFDGGYGNYPGYDHQVELPADLQGKTEVIVKVHAVVDGGKILVVEYKDTNIPVVVTDENQTKNLYRGDKIKIKFSMAKHPRRPTHINLSPAKDAVVMLDRLVDQHGKPIEHCGELVMFPQSPMVIFNVFAIKKDIGDDLFRTYTLINFEDPELFKALRLKAQAAWDQKISTVIRGRNYYVNPGITACAKGTVNMIDPAQANPQIVIQSAEDLSFN